MWFKVSFPIFPHYISNNLVILVKRFICCTQWNDKDSNHGGTLPVLNDTNVLDGGSLC
jgi:hypothetical protein